jgi:enoyl-CoA hydratase/carnithine racemase
MVLDGTPMTAQRIYELGGVNRVVPEGRSLETALEWASRLADRPAHSLAALKQMLIDNDDLHLSDALANEQRLFQSVVARPEAVEGMASVQSRFDAGESIREVYGGPRI